VTQRPSEPGYITRFIVHMKPYVSFIIYGLPYIAYVFIPIEASSSPISLTYGYLVFVNFFIWNCLISGFLVTKVGIGFMGRVDHKIARQLLAAAILMPVLATIKYSTGVMSSVILASEFVFALSVLFLVLNAFLQLARLIVAGELGRVARFHEYLGTFMLIWFFPLGIPLLQRRITKLSKMN